jgi:hypothetical protein
MKKLTYQDYLADPLAVTAQVRQEAQRARAQAVQRHFLAPLARLCGRLLAIRGVRLHLDPRPLVRQ